MSIIQSRRYWKKSFFPVGAVMPYAGSSAPSGWLLCDGSNKSRSTYAALFAAVSTTYGAGDGSTTFGIPDLRGRTVFGKDDMGGSAASRLTGTPTGGITGSGLGNTGGEQGHTLTSPAELPAHTHAAFQASTAPATGGVQAIANAAGAISTGSTGSGGAHNTVPPGIVLNYIIFAGV